MMDEYIKDREACREFLKGTEYSITTGGMNDRITIREDQLANAIDGTAADRVDLRPPLEAKDVRDTA